MTVRAEDSKTSVVSAVDTVTASGSDASSSHSTAVAGATDAMVGVSYKQKEDHEVSLWRFKISQTVINTQRTSFMCTTGASARIDVGASSPSSVVSMGTEEGRSFTSPTSSTVTKSLKLNGKSSSSSPA